MNSKREICKTYEVCEQCLLPKLWNRTASTNARHLVVTKILSNLQESPGICCSSSRTVYMLAITLMQISIHSHFLKMDPSVRRRVESNLSVYQSARLSTRIVIKQLTDASLGSQNPAWFTTHSPTESLTRFYSPPQTHSKGRIRLCPTYSQPQFIYNAICQGDVSDKRGVVIRRKLCP